MNEIASANEINPTQVEDFTHKLDRLKAEQQQLDDFSVLRLHQIMRINNNTSVMRVPGGWIYRENNSAGSHNGIVIATTFVPEYEATSYYNTAESEIRTEILMVENQQARVKNHTHTTVAMSPKVDTHGY